MVSSGVLVLTAEGISAVALLLPFPVRRGTAASLLCRSRRDRRKMNDVPLGGKTHSSPRSRQRSHGGDPAWIHLRLEVRHAPHAMDFFISRDSAGCTTPPGQADQIRPEGQASKARQEASDNRSSGWAMLYLLRCAVLCCAAKREFGTR
jgi:hypothetical protein